jgi:MoaA/NifB/PqqE/SkfB family radical SAM enzyme
MIPENLYKENTVAKVKQFSDYNELGVTINVEALRGCLHSCTGCFVNRVNNYNEHDIVLANQIAKGFADKGFRIKEVVLSPTDPFSAVNTVEILESKLWSNMFSYDPDTLFVSTAYFEKLEITKLEEVFNVFKNSKNYAKDLTFEFFVPMNPTKLIDRDPEYTEQIDKVLTWFREECPYYVDWAFATNVYDSAYLRDNFMELTDIVRDKYDTIIEILPSFFRSNDNELVKKSLKTWGDFSKEVITKDTYRKILWTCGDKYHATSNQITVNIRNGKCYISPFVYEQILYENESMLVEPTTSAIIKKVEELTEQQYRFAEKHEPCNDCSFLAACVGRNILNILEYERMDGCIYHRPVLDFFETNN